VLVDERSPEFRILLRPVIDDSARVVGVAGMILDEVWFRDTLLPRALKEPMEEYFPKAQKGDLSVRVFDGRSRPILRLGADEGLPEAATARIPFVFGDWTVALHIGRSTPGQWARANFLFNTAVTALLALTLVGGLLMALRAANRAMRLSEMKSDFVSNVSHELRTPVASIRVFAELLRHGRASTPEKSREYGEYIEAESRRLSRLIDNILDFSRIESGRKEYRFALSRIEDVVGPLVESFRMRLRPQGYEVTYEGPGEDLGEAEIDADAIGQALYNLLDNAVKYSGPSRRIHVSLGRHGGEIKVAIRDEGIGIPREEQNRIFERFHRVGTSLVHDVKGAGLGLAIVHHVMQAHHGRVTVKSEPDNGSTFTLWIPVGGMAGVVPAQNPSSREA
jgi:signal transduction histidine kinase